MAEPLLKRTFSRLRGKDRSRRKTDPKLSGEDSSQFSVSNDLNIHILFVSFSS